MFGIKEERKLYCPYCGHNDFESYPDSEIKKCKNCYGFIRLSRTWNKWYPSASPPCNPAHIPYKIPNGTKWKQGSTGWYCAQILYDAETGKKIKERIVKGGRNNSNW